ncbi:lysine N(6)-hydroxylase/L-ornithine N(5)-oxygenase family protein [Herbaspirillum sp. YR522]|uniref:lysine N(6)-hydroxylase/L-ornithine N(5)-oxygenase family protein n=1 Tax=Herbaspirillum sp. YR522 TaxID=1144342 RepID=UPI00026F5CE7|nr:SidA/IucD/PvdA family monooxygenase [Herbaspirillum sp. YR522]EJM98648.1 lysine/ornithine N-monooxygenase [Herbaspirillum sp. YR522]
MHADIHDFIAIGLGPFNLSLAALSAPLSGVDAVFLEARREFNWHPGLLLDDATLQNPFLADLVTLADPRSEFSFLNYCKQTSRLYSCYMREQWYLRRTEYNRYCQWVVGRLQNVRMGYQATLLGYDDTLGAYRVSGRDQVAGRGFKLHARKLVLGLGSVPRLPRCCNQDAAPYLHSADYLQHKPALLRRRRIVVIGSGQSAAEVYYDLLRASASHAFELTWITRAPRFFQMENSKLTLELVSPDYTDHFFSLPAHCRRRLLRRQASLYKGINANLIAAIYDLLDQRMHDAPQRYRLASASALRACHHDAGADCFRLRFRHLDSLRDFSLEADGVVFATGYRSPPPELLAPLHSRIDWGDDGRYRMTRDYAIDRSGGEIFVQNGGLDSHGIGNPDLGLCCHRNARILRALTGVEHYRIEPRTALQTFGPLPS